MEKLPKPVKLLFQPDLKLFDYKTVSWNLGKYERVTFVIDRTFPAGFFGPSVFVGGPFVTLKTQITVQYVLSLFMLKDFSTASNFLIKN